MTQTYLLQHKMLPQAVEYAVKNKERHGRIFDDVQKHGEALMRLAIHGARAVSKDDAYAVNFSHFGNQINGKRGLVYVFDLQDLKPPECPVIVIIENGEDMPHFFTVEYSGADVNMLCSWSGQEHLNHGTIALDLDVIAQRLAEMLK